MSGVTYDIEALGDAERTFCLAIVEYNGNLEMAARVSFGDSERFPVARARELLARPEVAKRIEEIARRIDEHASVSLFSHLSELARLRDMAAVTGQLKVAVGAEVKRGEAAGFYNRVTPKDPERQVGGVMISLPQGSAVTIEAWAKRQGKEPVVIDMPTK